MSAEMADVVVGNAVVKRGDEDRGRLVIYCLPDGS